ncbi:hypothetical protein BGZ97_003804 [Linnemannia gamsii]|jgi:hypothetical protein|uniref:F-box domain-containing protein n=1 Tax=Linnemannia gamsii TaxID=64522 RepID=A0A9P6UH74_9FUNG|nr:hypothetical protein BGZ97_003804 [Linnemannia gamsii]
MDTNLPPEIRLLILQYLSQHELTQVALVNKAWSESAIPIIWKSLWIMSENQAITLHLGNYKQHYRHFQHIESFHSRGMANAKMLLNKTTTHWTPRLRCLDIMVKNNNCYLSDDDREREVEDRRYASDSSDEYGSDYDWGEHYAREYDRPLVMNREEQEDLLEILRRNPQLKSFKFAMVPEDPQAFLIQLAPILPRLKHLELFHVPDRHRPVVNTAVADAFLRICPSTLESITFGVKFDTTATTEEATRTKVLIQTLIESAEDKHHPALRLLRLIDPMNKGKAEALAPFIKGCSNLRMIDAPAGGRNEWESHNDWIVATPAFHSALEEATGCRFGTLRGIPWYKRDIDDDESDKDQSVATRISTFSKVGNSKGYWHTLNLSFTKASTLTAKAIADTCHEGLNSLVVVKCEEFTSQEIQAILANATHLRHIECNRWFCDPGQPMLMAQDVLRSTWSCTWLVRFNLHIGGIPRPDIIFDEKGRSSAEVFDLDNCTIEKSHAMQRKIYRQLGRLTLLEELHLGYVSIGYAHKHQPRRVDKVQRNCLEMTLESGLGLLSELKNLRELGVAYMAHRIGKEEVDWMQANWPNLHTIQGVLYPTFAEEDSVSDQLDMMKGRGWTYA